MSKKLIAGILSLLVFGSQIPSGSACNVDVCKGFEVKSFSNMKAENKKSEIKLKGIFEIDGLKQALEEQLRHRHYFYRIFNGRIYHFANISLEFCGGFAKVKVGDKFFELAYDKLVNKETGEIEKIEIPSCIERIDPGVFKNILKNADAQGKKIKRVILPENLEFAFGAFEGVSVDSVVFKSNSSRDLNADIFKNAVRIGAVFVPKRFEEKVKRDLKDQNIKVFQDFELKNAFNIKGLKEAIMEALANDKKIIFKGNYWGSYPTFCVGDKEFYPDYIKLKDEKTGKIENLEFPYGVNYIDSPLIHNMCMSCDKNLCNSEINRVVIPDTVRDIGKGTFCNINANHVILSKNLRSLPYNAFGWTMKQVGFGEIFMGPNCKIKEITAPGKFELMLKDVFKNQKTEINVM